MSDKKIKSMVMAAVMAALTYVATTVIKIPAPTGGYVHIGDGLVLLCGWILGPWWGGAAAGIGSMLVDLLGGYMSFVPGTLIIKFLDAMAAALIVKALGRKTYSYVVGGLAGEAIMVAGYFVYEALALQLGMGAAAGVLANVGQGAVGLVIALVLMALLTLYIKRSRMGRASRACAQDMQMANLLGIDTNKVISFTFVLGAMLAAVGGVLIALAVGKLNPFIGFLAGIKAFTAAVLGGIGSIPGAMLGGVILGVAETFAAAYISSEYKDIVAFGLLVLILLFRPTGLLGKPEVEKV